MKRKTLLGITFASLLGMGALVYFKGEIISRSIDPYFTANNPAAVANDYWIVLLSQESGRAARFSMYPDQHTDWVAGYSEHDRAILGKVDKQEGIYHIETDLFLYRDGSRHHIPLYTVVNSLDGEFKVDEAASLFSFYDLSLTRALGSYSNSVGAATMFFEGSKLEGENQSQFQEVALHNIKVSLCGAHLKLSQQFSSAPIEPLEGCAE